MPPSLCLLAAYSSASFIRLVPRPAVRVVPRFAPSRLICSPCLLSLRLLAASSSVSPFSPPIVSPGGASLISLPSRHAFDAPACLLTALRSARPRVAIADIIASFLRSVDTVPLPPRFACAVGCFSRRVCAILCAVAMGTIRWEVFVPRFHKLPQFTVGVVVVFQFS